MAKQRLRVADLFCGAGGLSEGFRQAGAAIVVGIDSDPDACATYALNFPAAQCIHGDVREAGVRRELLRAAAGVDIIIGGPPCQAFSQVRNHARLIDDPRNSLYREFVRMVGKLEPAAFMMENVPGLTQMGIEGQVLEDLELGGTYSVTAQVLDAADFGVPQTRRRLVFLGIHHSLGLEPPALAGTGATDALLWVRRESKAGRPRYDITERRAHAGFLRRLLDPEDASVVNAEQAIGDLEMLKAGTREDVLSASTLPPASSAYQRLMREGLGETLGNTSVPRINADTVLRLAGLPPGGNYRDLSVKLQERYLTGALWGPSNGTGQLGRRHYYAYRRLHPGGFSWTLNTKADSIYHYRARRALSVREFARMQSFPDRFIFTTDPRKGELPGRIDGGAGHSRYRQAGNAVPPLLARAVASAMLAAIAGDQRARRTA